MKKLMIIALMLAAGTAWGQKKSRRHNTRYFLADIEYTLDCGKDWAIQTIAVKDGGSPTYDNIYRSFKNWCYPHKIKSFYISSLWEKDKKVFQIVKRSKFKCPEPPLPLNITTTDTAKVFIAPSVGLSTGLGYYDFVYRSDGTDVLRILPPDSTHTVTVKLDKTRIHFINDSTFTFKQQ